MPEQYSPSVYFVIRNPGYGVSLAENVLFRAGVVREGNQVYYAQRAESPIIPSEARISKNDMQALGRLRRPTICFLLGRSNVPLFLDGLIPELGKVGYNTEMTQISDATVADFCGLTDHGFMQCRRGNRRMVVNDYEGKINVVVPEGMTKLQFTEIADYCKQRGLEIILR